MTKRIRVAVVGGGIFGVTAAVELASAGFSVELFERAADLLSGASGINQYRLHRGYHYPRSPETALSSRESEASFRRVYGPAMMDGYEHYYAIAAKGSLVTADDYVRFMDALGLEYRADWPEVVRRGPVEACFRVRESLFGPDQLRALCRTRLRESGVRVHLRTEATLRLLDPFDMRVIATYAALNELLSGLPGGFRSYQFEVCEKPVVRLPAPYARRSVVVMDGPFMCLDPLGTSGLHVMGNVVHAIHHTSVGEVPEVPPALRPLLNRGVVEAPAASHFARFVESGSEFLAGLAPVQHVGSMFTVRTVLPLMDATDARPTIVQRVDDRTVALFSGKVGTCVLAAREVLRVVRLHSAPVPAAGAA